MAELAATLRELKQLGTAQNRKVYKRHGAEGDAFGVSYANLKKLTKKIKPDHALAVGLWQSGNHDACILATMIADSEQATLAMINDWAKGLNNYVITGAVAGFVRRTRFAHNRMKQWSRACDEWICSAG